MQLGKAILQDLPARDSVLTNCVLCNIRKARNEATAQFCHFFMGKLESQPFWIGVLNYDP